MQLASRERRLEHVAGVHRTLGLAGAHEGVDLVDEQDDPALLLRQIVEHRLHPLLELAPELRPRDQRAHVQRQEALALQALRDFGVDDPLRQPFDDGGLAHPGLADQHRVVLRAPLQHLDGAADLVVAPDHRIELALFGPLGEVDRELLQRLPVLLRVRIVHGLAAADRIDGRRDRFLRGAVAHQQIGRAPARLEAGEDEQLARYESILPLPGELVAEVEVAPEVVRDLHVAGHSGDPWQRVQRDTELRSQRVHVDPCLGEEVPDRGALLVEQRRHHVHRFQELVVAAQREAPGVRQRHLELGRELVHSHVRASCAEAGSRGDARTRAEAADTG